MLHRCQTCFNLILQHNKAKLRGYVQPKEGGYNNRKRLSNNIKVLDGLFYTYI